MLQHIEGVSGIETRPHRRFQNVVQTAFPPPPRILPPLNVRNKHRVEINPDHFSHMLLNDARTEAIGTSNFKDS